jgi:H+/gluconate symporter-like permease
MQDWHTLKPELFKKIAILPSGDVTFTFTMTALPGTPAIRNAIPMPFFGTNAFSAPALGTLAGLIMLPGGRLWLTRRRKNR